MRRRPLPPERVGTGTLVKTDDYRPDWVAEGWVDCTRTWTLESLGPALSPLAPDCGYYEDDCLRTATIAATLTSTTCPAFAALYGHELGYVEFLEWGRTDTLLLDYRETTDVWGEDYGYWGAFCFGSDIDMTLDHDESGMSYTCDLDDTVDYTWEITMDWGTEADGGSEPDGGDWTDGDDCEDFPGFEGALPDTVYIEDCDGACYPASWVGDGECEDGTTPWGGNFDCEAFGFDGGDCL